MTTDGDLTLGPGNSGDLSDAMGHMYDELRRVAQRQMARERSSHTLQPTALVGEVYEKLVANDQFSWQNQAHFAAMAAGAMRQILVDHARRRNTNKRGGDVARVTLFEEQVAEEDSAYDIVALDEAITKLSSLHPELARLVELRFFSGLNHASLMSELDQSRRTLDKNWAFAKAWLARELGD